MPYKLFMFHWSEPVTRHHLTAGREKCRVLYTGKGRKTRNWRIMITALAGPLYSYPHVTDDKTEAREGRLLV